MRARGVRLLAALFLGLSSGVLVGLPAHAQSVGQCNYAMTLRALSVAQERLGHHEVALTARNEACAAEARVVPRWTSLTDG